MLRFYLTRLLLNNEIYLGANMCVLLNPNYVEKNISLL